MVLLVLTVHGLEEEVRGVPGRLDGLTRRDEVGLRPMVEGAPRGGRAARPRGEEGARPRPLGVRPDVARLAAVPVPATNVGLGRVQGRPRAAGLAGQDTVASPSDGTGQGVPRGRPPPKGNATVPRVGRRAGTIVPPTVATKVQAVRPALDVADVVLGLARLVARPVPCGRRRPGTGGVRARVPRPAGGAAPPLQGPTDLPQARLPGVDIRAVLETTVLALEDAARLAGVLAVPKAVVLAVPILGARPRPYVGEGSPKVVGPLVALVAAAPPSCLIAHYDLHKEGAAPSLCRVCCITFSVNILCPLIISSSPGAPPTV